MAKPKLLSIFSLSAVACALIVISLGALTRLIDAGLGCPDWPFCYGHLTVPMNETTRELLRIQYPMTPLVVYKAWAEMIHRYVVGALSLFILMIVFIIFKNKNYRTRTNIVLALSLILLLIYQIMLGRWTVTLKLLPVIVTQHLLGGFLILTFLWLIYLSSRKQVTTTSENNISGWFFLFCFLGLILLFFQISLGAWTSTNYASLSCTDFPFCMNQANIDLQLKAAFNLTAPIGINYEGGILSQSVRQTIHMTHRLGAFIFVSYFFLFLSLNFKKLKSFPNLLTTTYIILGLICAQIALGITNVIFKLPLIVAISHNLIAAFLFLAMTTLTYQAWINHRKIAV